MTEAHKNILSNLKKTALLSLAWWIVEILLAALTIYTRKWLILIAIAVLIAVRILLINYFSLYITYELDDDTRSDWEAVLENWKSFGRSKRIWLIEKIKSNRNSKSTGGADVALDRSRLKANIVKPGLISHAHIRSNEKFFYMHGKKCRIFLMPDMIIIKKLVSTKIYLYSDIDVTSSRIEFIEEKRAVKDATIASHTWQHVNKNGTKDKRYKENVKIPVYRYGLLLFEYNDKTPVELQVSNEELADVFANTYNLYSDYISNAEGDE